MQLEFSISIIGINMIIMNTNVPLLIYNDIVIMFKYLYFFACD